MTTPIPGLQPRCFALVPAAGIGARSGADRPKQYVPIAGRAMITHTLGALSRVAKLAATLVVLSPQDALFENSVPEFRGARSWIARCGGDTRAISVSHGLRELQVHGAQPHDWVLVHDAARCLVQPRWIEKLIATCWDDAVGGLLALPVADTLKQASHGRATGTVDRGSKWAAQTPQMFRLGMLQQALLEAGDEVTDEASAIEALGHQPLLVEAALENFKVTWPADFALAERLLRSRT